MSNLFLKMCYKNKLDFLKLIFCNFILAFVLGFQVKIIDLFFESISLYLKNNLSLLEFSLYIFLFLGIILLNPIVNSCFTYICKKFEEKSFIFLKEIYYEKLSKEEAINFQSTSFLNKQTEIKNGIYSFIEYIISLFDATLVYGIYFLVVFFYLLNLQKELIIIPIILAIPTVLLQIYNYKLANNTNTLKSKTNRKIQNYLDTMIASNCHKETRIRYLKGFFMKKYKNSINELNNIELKYTLKSIKIEFAFKLFFLLSYIFSISILFFFAFKKQITIYSMSSIIISMELLKTMIDEFIGYTLTSISKNYGNSKSFIEYITLDKKYRKNINLDIAPDINLENVDFKYPEDENIILKDINLNIKAGEFIAIVGENGSGKTTLIKLIQGLYLPTNGNIKFKCNNYIYNSKSYKISNVTTLFQNFKRYKLDLFTNISISEKSSNENKIFEIMRKINFNFDKEIYPKGLYTVLSKDFDGIDISIGQWQRIALLRTLYKSSSKILCLDEPTSAIDPLEEDFFYKTFKDFSKNKTCIMITHRMASLKYADRIIYLEDGKIIDFSTHENLMRIPNYKKMFNSQADLYK